MEPGSIREKLLQDPRVCGDIESASWTSGLGRWSPLACVGDWWEYLTKPEYLASQVSRRALRKFFVPAVFAAALAFDAFSGALEFAFVDLVALTVGTVAVRFSPTHSLVADVMVVLSLLANACCTLGFVRAGLVDLSAQEVGKEFDKFLCMLACFSLVGVHTFGIAIGVASLPLLALAASPSNIFLASFAGVFLIAWGACTDYYTSCAVLWKHAAQRLVDGACDGSGCIDLQSMALLEASESLVALFGGSDLTGEFFEDLLQPKDVQVWRQLVTCCAMDKLHPISATLTAPRLGKESDATIIPYMRSTQKLHVAVHLIPQERPSQPQLLLQPNFHPLLSSIPEAKEASNSDENAGRTEARKQDAVIGHDVSGPLAKDQGASAANGAPNQIEESAPIAVAQLPPIINAQHLRRGFGRPPTAPESMASTNSGPAALSCFRATPRKSVNSAMILLAQQCNPKRNPTMCCPRHKALANLQVSLTRLLREECQPLWSCFVVAQCDTCGLLRSSGGSCAYCKQKKTIGEFGVREPRSVSQPPSPRSLADDASSVITDDCCDDEIAIDDMACEVNGELYVVSCTPRFEWFMGSSCKGLELGSVLGVSGLDFRAWLQNEVNVVFNDDLVDADFPLIKQTKIRIEAPRTTTKERPKKCYYRAHLKAIYEHPSDMFGELDPGDPGEYIVKVMISRVKQLEAMPESGQGNAGEPVSVDLGEMPTGLKANANRVSL